MQTSRWLALTITAVLLSHAAAAGAQPFRKGPYLQSVDRTGITVMWEAGAACPGLVRYGPGEVRDQTVQAPDNGPLHTVRLAGLQPSTTYSYVVECGDDTSEPGRFATAPDPDEPFTFLVYGDTRSNHDQHRTVVQAMLPEAADFALHTGDMVSDGEEADQWQTFFEIERELLRDVPVYPTVGNHEEHDGHVDLLKRFFSPPTESSDREEYYAFTYGNARFLVIDSHVDALLGGPGLGQTFWLDAELRAHEPEVRHHFVVVHMGPYSSKPGRTGNWGLKLFWMDRFRDAGIGMILSGHDHYYERGADPRGLRYAIVGGGGAPLYDTTGPGQRLDRNVYVSQSILSYVVFTITGGLVEGCAKDTLGNTIECFSWGDAGPVEEPQCGLPADCAGRPHDDCEGEFSCLDGLCVWECAGPGEDPGPAGPECLVDADCQHLAIPGHCPDSTWFCGPNQACILDCDLGQGECADDADCTGRDPLPHCNGAWVCTDAVCEFDCNAGPPDDPGDDPPPDDPGEDPPPDDEPDPPAPLEPWREGPVGPEGGEDPVQSSGRSSEDGCRQAPGAPRWPALLLRR